MTASPAGCGAVENQVYLEAGTVTVSFTSVYELADAGNLLGFTGTGRGVVDIVINVYEDSFDPTNPGSGRIATIDEGEALTLEAGKSYVLVIQPYCENTSGVFAVVIRGSGVIAGAGFESAAYTNGQHSLSDPISDFPMGIGFHAYDVSDPVQVPQTGIYYFGAVGINFNADVTLLAYEGSFDPFEPSDNLVGAVSFTGSLTLSKNKTYIFVMVDQFDLEGNWQYVLFPPGAIRFNESLKGAWVTPGVGGSGVMLEIGTQTGILFFAWFTFPEAPPPVLGSKANPTPESNPANSVNTDLGSTDQRWLTGFGAIPTDSNLMNIKYENTSGGFFNAMTPVPITDSNYGTGTVTVIDCSNIVISYDLPGGLLGSAPMVRALPEGKTACLQSINAAPVVQNP